MATVNIGNLTFTHKGDYASGTAYVKNDVVYYATNGNAYIAKQNTTGNVPTNGTYWSQFAAGSGGIWNAGLSIGSANQSLRVNSGGNALEFYTPTAGGLLACYYANWNTQSTATGTTKTTMYTSANRTLASTSSKMLIMCDLSIGGQDYGGSVGLEFSTDDGSNWSSITTLDMQDTDNNQLNAKAMIGHHPNLTNGNGQQMMIQDSFTHLHSPNSTQVRYRLVMAASDTSYTITHNRRGSGGWGGLSHMTEMEIGV